MKKEKNEELNINEEYEKLVPPTERKSIFEESEDYESLREYIMAQPLIKISNKKLPFEGIKLIDYVDFKFNEYIEQATLEHKHLFFIKQSIKGKPEFCNAAGYYDKNENNFTLLPYSYIVKEEHGIIPFKYSRDKSTKEGCNQYITFSVKFSSPEDAATFVLGQQAGLNEWVDRRGKGLLNYYSKLTSNTTVIIDENDDEFNFSSKKIFHINVIGICRAAGYFDYRTGNFYIIKNSLLALNADPDFEKSASGIARNRMIVSNCSRSNEYYIVNKDTKCRSASAAASYVLGKDSSYVEWEDLEGKALKDYYPNRFYHKKVHNDNPTHIVENINSIDSIPYFHIKETNEQGSECNAAGYYDVTTKKFVLKEGSILALKVDNTYFYSVKGRMRRLFILKNCNLNNSGFKLKKDFLFDSPGEAASYVLGKETDGLYEWRTKDGTRLIELINPEDIQKKT